MPPILLALVVAVVVSQLAILTTTVYCHRALAHKALSFHGPMPFLFRFFTWITTGIKPREWAAVHRKHHAFTDEPDDPHSPKQLGWVRVQLTNPYLYRKAARQPGTVERYARDLPPDRWDRMLFDRAFLGLGLGVAMLCVLFTALYGPAAGIALGLFAGVVHAVGYLMLNGAVNAVGHQFGRRPYPNSATNNQWLAWITSGEGLHNNHHAAPTSAKLALHKGEIDPGWWLIAACRSVGLAKVRLNRVVLAPAAGGTDDEPVARAG